MAYINELYYKNDYHGEPVDEADFPSLCDRAAEIVEEMCMYRIRESCMDTYGVDTQERIRKAVCAQIEYLDANGGSEMDNGTDLQSASLGKFNYTRAGAGTTGESRQSIYAPRAQRILAPTGLLYRGGGCY